MSRQQSAGARLAQMLGMRPVLIGIGLLMSSTANAEPDAFVERPLALTAQAGVGTPLGFYGIAADLALRSDVSIEAGVGRGLVGTQVSAQVRARVVPLGANWLALGAGLSEGHYEHRDPFYGIEYMPTVVDRAYWANVELSIERRTLQGFDVRVYAGAGAVFAGERQRCSDNDAGTVPCSGSARGLWAPYIGLSVGYALKI